MSTRRTVHLTRTEHVLALPASLSAVAALVGIVQSELTAAGRSTSEAELRVVEGELLAYYDVPRAAMVPR